MENSLLSIHQAFEMFLDSFQVYFNYCFCDGSMHENIPSIDPLKTECRRASSDTQTKASHHPVKVLFEANVSSSFVT